MRRRDSVQRRANIFRGAISIRRLGDAGLLGSAADGLDRNYCMLTLGGKFISGGGRSSSETSRCWFMRSVGMS